MARQLVLTFNGNPMEDFNELSQYGIAHGSHLDCALKIKPTDDGFILDEEEKKRSFMDLLFGSSPKKNN